MDQFRVFAENSLIFFPVITLVLGFVGSTHCLGMCGAIALNCSESRKKNYSYQLGRLTGYLVVASVLGVIGQFILGDIINHNISFIASIVMGGALIWMGVSPYLVKIEVFSPALRQNILTKLLTRSNKRATTTYLIGIASIFLPCGLIYGLLLPLMAVKSIEISLLSVLTFWIGTLPIMSMAPYLIQKLLVPFKRKAPIFVSICLVFMGISVLTSRFVSLPDQALLSDSEKLMCL